MEYAKLISNWKTNYLACGSFGVSKEYVGEVNQVVTFQFS